MKHIQLWPTRGIRRFISWAQWRWFKFRHPMEVKYIQDVAWAMATEIDRQILEGLKKINKADDELILKAIAEEPSEPPL